MNIMRQLILSLITVVAMTATMPAMAQNNISSFSMMTLNVDGLPGKLLFFTLNADGPKAAGSKAIGTYMAAKDCDIIAMQEDFNYRWEIWSRLFASYEHDEWTGGIILEEMQDQDFIHPHHIKLKCDGLNTAWKRECQSTAYERVAWGRNFGKFSHAFDDLITKGFRRHEFTLQDGTEVVVYNVHLDASNRYDVPLGRDMKDRETRLSQFEQLRQHIMERLDNRPVVVVGDMNCLYYRDALKTAFIDAIQATGLATVSDAWVEKHLGGAYPELGSEPLADETFDKVLYINPTNAKTVITPTSVEVDKAGYTTADGKPLGDHYPLIVRFAIIPAGETTGISTVATSSSADEEWYSLQGVRQEANFTPFGGRGAISISRSGQKKIRK